MTTNGRDGNDDQRQRRQRRPTAEAATMTNSRGGNDDQQQKQQRRPTAEAATTTNGRGGNDDQQQRRQRRPAATTTTNSATNSPMGQLEAAAQTNESAARWNGRRRSKRLTQSWSGRGDRDQGGRVRPSSQSGTVAKPNTNTPTDVILHGNAADEAEWHRAKASRAPHDGGDKSTGSGPGARRQRRHVEPQGDAGGGHAPSPSPSEESEKNKSKQIKLLGSKKMRTNTDVESKPTLQQQELTTQN